MNWSEYEDKYYINPNSILKNENDCFREMIIGLELKNKKCLDFGCGSGHWIKLYLSQGAIVAGADIYSNAIIRCRTLYPNCDFSLLNDKKILYDDSSFDIVIAGWVLQEIYVNSDFERWIAEINRILQKNGLIFIVENVYPVKRFLRESTVLGDIFDNKGEPSLLRFFPKNSLIKILKKFGFKRRNYKLAGDSFFEIYEK